MQNVLCIIKMCSADPSMAQKFILVLAPCFQGTAQTWGRQRQPRSGSARRLGATDSQETPQSPRVHYEWQDIETPVEINTSECSHNNSKRLCVRRVYRCSITRAVPGGTAETKGFSQDVPLSKASIYLLPEAQQVKKSLLNILFYVPSIT